MQLTYKNSKPSEYRGHSTNLSGRIIFRIHSKHIQVPLLVYAYMMSVNMAVVELYGIHLIVLNCFVCVILHINDYILGKVLIHMIQKVFIKLQSREYT
jgi:hypothetical protein